MDELVPTRSVWRGSGAAHPLVLAPVDFTDLNVETTSGTLSWAEALDAAFTDGIVVLRGGEIVHEQYFGSVGPHSQHSMMSCNKSIVGLLAEVLIAEGVLEAAAPVASILPELDSSAWADAAVRDVLDMRVGLAYDEDYANPDSDVWRFLQCTGMVPARPGNEGVSIAEVLPTFAKRGDHGRAFEYQEPNIFVLGWLVRRAAGMSLSELVSSRLWQRLGAEHDAYYMLDPSGAETTLACTLRDFARFGQLVVDGGRTNGEQTIPGTVIDAFLRGGDHAAFAEAGMATLPGWSYRSQWWIRHVGSTTHAVARGAYGQMLYIDPVHRIVIARFGSAPQASSALLDPIVLPTVDAIIACLTG